MCSMGAGEALEVCVGPVRSAGQFDYKYREAGIPAPLMHNQEISHHHLSTSVFHLLHTWLVAGVCVCACVYVCVHVCTCVCVCVLMAMVPACNTCRHHLWFG